MATVFVDTEAWIALLNRSEDLNERAMQMMQTLRMQDTHLLTTESVLLEVADALSAPGVRGRTVAFLDELLEVTPVSLRIRKRILDKNLRDREVKRTKAVLA